MSDYLLSQAELLAGAGQDRIGGKAAGLVRLARLEMPVPPFAVLTTRAWALCDEGRGEIPIEIRRELLEAWAALGQGPLAVRSSALAEDGARCSWAGQLDSFLGVEGPAALSAAVRAAWASGVGDRALAYGAIHGVQPGPVAVVLQVLIEGEASGVLFSRDPENPDVSLISAGYGLGEGVVSGRVPCDTYRVAGDGKILAEIADKDEAVGRFAGGTAPRPVEEALRQLPALADEVLLRLALLGRQLEADLGAPVDVEFTVAKGSIYLLQVRPITIPIARGAKALWDNSNIVESYSGVTTPLTFTFASRAYTIVYQLFSSVMGVSPEVVRAHEPTYRRMIGYLNGRIYYNLNSWYTVLSLLPGFSFNRGAMETMMGVSEVAGDDVAGKSRVSEGISLLRLLARLGWRLFRLEGDARRFRGTFRRALVEARARDLSALAPDELVDVFERAERELLWAWTPPLVNDFFTMIFYKLLQNKAIEITGDPKTALHNRLLAGEGSLASAVPARELESLAALARESEGLRGWMTSDEPDATVFSEAMGHDRFRAAWESWMGRFGDRSPDELKLEAPTLRDTPFYVLQTVRALVAREPSAPLPGDPRREAMAEWRHLNRGFFKGAWRNFVLRQARARVAMREELRLERTRVFGLVRDIFRALEQHLLRAEVLSATGDIYFLTVEEVLGFVRGTAPSVDLRGLVALRRAENERWKSAPPLVPRLRTWGAVHLHNRLPVARPPQGAVGAQLVGTPSSAGAVRAPARVVRDPRARPDLGGGILVAERTDPGWVPLFATASGVLVERGSLLSHSAVVARELGLPAIVGLSGLMTWVRDGELLEMDGSTGIVRREHA